MPDTNFSGVVTSQGVPIFSANPNVYGRHWFVDGNRGLDGNRGRDRGNPLKTMGAALDRVGSGDEIHVRGNITENLTAPAGIFDVTITGAGNRPRHADADTGNNGYSAATWKASVQTDPLLILRQQGWTIRNILFDCPTSDAALQFIRDAASGDSERDSSHTTIQGCRFASGATGILISGTENIFNVEIAGCIFNDLTDAIDSPGAYAYRWDIHDNMFMANTNHIDCGFTQAVIRRNVFGKFTTMSIDLTGGANNMVVDNDLSGTYDNGGGYIAGTDDEWFGNRNSLTGGITADDPAA